MSKEDVNVKYSKRVWLNDENNPSTGSVVAYHGDVIFVDGKCETAFLEIADCHTKCRLHLSAGDTPDDFIKKMELLRDTIDNFVKHLHQDLERRKHETETN